MKNKLFKLLIALQLLFCNVGQSQTYTPQNYWTFNSTPTTKDSTNATSLDFTSYACQYTVSNGLVGKAINITIANGSIINCNQFNPDTAFTIEFLLKPGYNFNQCMLLRRLDGGIALTLGQDGFNFQTSNNGTTTDELKTDFQGLGRNTFGYYIDGNWHHIAIRFNKLTGLKQIFVDGECPAGFSKNAPTGRIPSSTSTFTINQTVSYQKIDGAIDEIALWKTDLPATLIYKHYLEALQGKSYSYTNNTSALPTPSPTTAPLDSTEFAPGYLTPTVSALTQLQSYPLPRYKVGNTLLKNFNWIDMMYFGGRFQPGVSDASSVTTSTLMNEELARNWNYMLQLKLSTDAWGTAWINSANANPQWGTSIITLRAQLYPSNINRQDFTSSFYMQNSAGSFLSSPDGNAGSSHKWWRPSNATSTYDNDGDQQRANLQQITNLLTRPITIINENGEVFPWFRDNAIATDPVVNSARIASGLDAQTYLARRFRDTETLSYRDKFMNLPALANTKFTEYAIDGFSQYRMKYSEARTVNYPINGQYYSTPDFYPRWPNNWRNWTAAWHGWQWIVDSRYNELAVGDNLFSPFLAAGWDVNEQNNMRPAQFLGLIKCLNMIGAEFFYAGYFNEAGSYNPPNPPPGNPANYAWQAALPSYAQAVASRYETLLRNGQVMTGDYPAYFSTPTVPGYAFWTGDLRKIVVVRKSNTSNYYAITGTIQPNSSMIGNAEKTSVATITLNGQQLKFNVTRQGSTYIYDNTIPAAPIFYQLDGWHEATHPSWWTNNFNFESEVSDSLNNVVLKTQVPTGTTSGDYTNYTSYTSFNSNGMAIYNFQPRTSNSYYLWIRARVKGIGQVATLNLNLDAGATKTIGCINDTAWQWYRYDNSTQQPLAFSGVSALSHQIKFTSPTAFLEVDKFVLTPSSTVLYTGTTPCNGTAVATITANGPTTFCQGGNVVLTANSGTSYLWSNGATTQSITVTTSGNYTVMVTTAQGTATSAPTSVTVNNLLPTTITAGGPTTFCVGQNVTLQVTSGQSYLWSTGATTQSIVSTTSNTYTVTVTYAGGCSSSSSPLTVTVNPNPTVSITPGGPITLCSGTATLIAATTPTNSIQWYVNNSLISGATTSTFITGVSGYYNVIVTDANGCTATSNTVQININSISAIVTPSAITICEGQATTFSASTGSGYAYQWYRNGNVKFGATSSTYTTSQSGNYSVVISQNGACTTTSNVGVLTVTNNPKPTITATGATTICTGSNVTLIANIFSGVTYQWQRNSTDIAGATSQNLVVSTAGKYRVKETANGCTKQSSTIQISVVNCRLGAPPSAVKPKCDIDPTYADKFVNVIMQNAYITNIQITDILGHVIIDESFNVADKFETKSYDISTLKDGTYMFHVLNSNNEDCVAKIVVMHQ